MNTSKRILENKNILTLIFGVVLVIVTFPSYEIGVQHGIDPPLKWVFTDLAVSGYSKGISMTFPHGPLAYLMYPLQETLLATVVFTTIIKLSFVFIATRLFSDMCFLRWVQVLVSAYFIFVLCSINQLIIATALISYFGYFKHETWSYKLFGFVLTAIALYIKSYVAILCGLITIFFIGYYLIKKRNILQSLLDTTILFGLMYAIWVFLFNSPFGFFDYLYGMMQLAQDNSSAAAYYPVNNWWLLSGFLIVFFTVPFIQKSKRSYFFGVLMVPTLFAAWKHGMAREDIYHVNGLLTFVLMISILFLLFERTRRLLNTAFLSVGIFLFAYNMSNAYNYSAPDFQWLGAGQFFDFVSGNTLAMKDDHIQANRLPQDVKQLIEGSTVDVYPWDYSIASINHLTWQPRPVIHSYAAYTPWLDKRDAEHFCSEKAPKFVIWEIDKITSDCNSSMMNSIDGRYLLNNEPETIIELMKNYKGIYRDKKFLILQQRDKPLSDKKTLIKSEKSTLNQWLTPPSVKDLLRVKVEFNRTTKQRIKSFLYKDEQYWIEMRLNSGAIHRYRIVPKNAANGLWINPYIHTINNEKYEVAEIRIIGSNHSLLDSQLNFEWEKISFSEEDALSQFFHLHHPKAIELIDRQIAITKPSTFDQEYSQAVELNLDSLERGTYKIHAQSQIKDLALRTELQMVFEINGNWSSTFIADQILNEEEWNQIVTSRTFEYSKNLGKAKVYLFNPAKSSMELNDFLVVLEKME